MSYLQNCKKFEAEILDLQLEKYGLSFDIKKCTSSGLALGDENVIGIRPFKRMHAHIPKRRSTIMVYNEPILTFIISILQESQNY